MIRRQKGYQRSKKDEDKLFLNGEESQLLSCMKVKSDSTLDAEDENWNHNSICNTTILCKSGLIVY